MVMGWKKKKTFFIANLFPEEFAGHMIMMSLIIKSQVALVVKSPPANAGDTRDPVSIPGSGRSSGGGNGNPLQYSCLENPMDRGVLGATVHGVAKS